MDKKRMRFLDSAPPKTPESVTNFKSPKILYTGVSDARLFYENKQGNLKNTPKIGNLMEKTSLALGRKIQKNKKSTGKLNAEVARQILKNKPKMCKFAQKHAQTSFSSKLKQQKCHTILKKAIHKTVICKKQAQKTSKF